MEAPETAVSYAAAILAAILVIICMMPATEGASRSQEPPARVLSNSGIVLIEDAADSVIYGREVYPEGDMIGSYIWSGDINGDGIDDIGLSSMTGDETRGVNFIHGSKEGFPELIDMSDPSSASFSLNYTARQIEVADYDSDGKKDLIMSGQLLGDVFLHLANSSGYSDKATPLGSMGVKQQTWEYPYSDFIWAGDLDGDGLDDIIMGAFGCGSYLAAGIVRPDMIKIYWSKSGNITTFTADKWDDFASSIGVGDLDGDGHMDMVVGVPKADPEDGTPRNFGAVCIYFNITRFDRAAIFHPYETADTMIYGSDIFDQFGWNVMLEDINGDGKDDILTGAPEADGVQNLKSSCGEIMVYYGKDNRSFPALMDAENDADVIIIGASGRTTDPDYSGDKIGRVFQLSDMDGNGELEFIIPIPTKFLDPLDGASRDGAGSICLYESKNVIPKTGRIAALGYPSTSYTIEGRDMGDSVGWQVRVGDINGDGLDDMIIGVPQADGRQNIARNSGEVYIIQGEGIKLREYRISGPASSARKVFTMGGTFDMNLSFDSSEGYGKVDGGRLVLGSGSEAVSIICEEGVFRKESDSYGSVVLHTEGCSLDGSGRSGWLNFRMELCWHFPFEGPMDVRFDLTGPDTDNLTRLFSSSAVVCKDIGMTDTLKVHTGEDELMMKGSYVAPGASMVLGDSIIVYKDEPQRDVPFWTLRIDHYEGETLADHIDYVPGWSVEFAAPKEGDREHSLVPSVDPSTYPEDLPSKYLPGIGEPLTYMVRVDHTPPLPPTGLKAVSIDGNENISRTGEFIISWDYTTYVEGDRNLSGIREYWITVEGSDPVLSLESGGLMGTYFDDLGSYQRGKEVLDETLHFTSGDWGPFGPDPNLMLPNDYSIRWWGWLDMGDAENQFFKFLGSGDVRFYLDGERIVDWTPIKKGLILGGFDFKKEEYRRIEIAFRHRSGDSFFSFMFQDGSGSFSTVPSTSLLHPSVSQKVIIGDDTGIVKVHSVDWVGHISNSAAAELYRDTLGPVFDLSGIPHWVNTTLPIFEIGVRDAEVGSSPNSGLDPGSVRFRTMDGEGVFSEWEPPSKVKESGDVPGSYVARIEPELTNDWRGRIQLIASDMEANSILSPMVGVGVDRRSPELFILRPAFGDVIEGNSVNILIRATDLGGSGFDGSTLGYIMRSGGTWSEWTGVPFDVEGEEVVLNMTLYLPFGMLELRFGGSDLMRNNYLTPIFMLTVREPVVNIKPHPVIKLPLNNSVHRYGVPVHLSSEGTYDDGLGEYSPVRMTWTSSEQGLLGTGRSLDVVLHSGEHIITLYADDGAPGHNVSVSIHITILEQNDPNGTDRPPIEEDGPGWLAFVVVFFGMVFLVIAVLTIMVVLIRKRQDDETRLGVVSETEDDIAYGQKNLNEDED
ncbi:MAG: FG-GAP-like repeat-containing protein [Thermoplasmatota archaeon]